MKRNNVAKRWLCYSLMLLICGCTSEQEAEIPEHIENLDNLTIHPATKESALQIMLKKEVSYGDTEEIKRGRIIGNITVDENGRVYVPDFQAKMIHVYNADGSYHNSIGREGKGPGEFQMIWTLRVANTQLHVLDYIHQRISVFDLETQKHLLDLPLPLNQDGVQEPSWLAKTRQNGLFYKPINFYVRPDEYYYIFFGDEDIGTGDNIRGRTYEVSVYDPAEKKYLEHDLFTFEYTGQIMVYERDDRMAVFSDIPYKRSSQFSYSGTELIYGWTDEMLFKVYDEDGNYQQAFYHPQSGIPFEVEDALAQYQNPGGNIVRAIRNDTLPETWPAFDAMKLDDKGRLWISAFTSDPHTYDWRVMDTADGQLLTQFRWQIGRASCRGRV